MHFLLSSKLAPSRLHPAGNTSRTHYVRHRTLAVASLNLSEFIGIYPILSELSEFIGVLSELSE
jgi:hypothetical protein